MDIIYLIISMTLPVAGGAFFVRWLLRSDTLMDRGEALFFGIGAGFGFTAFSMFILGLARVPFSRASEGLPILLLTVIFFVLSRRAGAKTNGLPNARGPGLRGWRLYFTIIMASWIALKVGFVSYEALTRPVYSYDIYTNWAVSGKFFYYRAGLLLDPLDEHFFGRGYRAFIGHPLHLPLLQTWIAIALGKFHEVYVKAPGALYFIGVLGVLYHAVKREAGAFYALITVFFLATVPIFTVHGQDSYADLPLCFFALAGTVTLWRFLRDDNLSYLLLSGIFFAMAIFVKNEGVFFALAGGSVLALYLFMRKRSFITPLTAFIIPMIILVGPWLLFKFHYGFGFGHSGPSSGFEWFSSNPLDPSAPRTGVHWEVLGIGLREIFLTANYNVIFPLWIVASLIAIISIAKTKLKYLYMITLLVASMFFFTYLTLEVTAVTQRTGIHRNTLTYLPLIYFTTALALSSIWPDPRKGASQSESPAACPPPLTGEAPDDIL